MKALLFYASMYEAVAHWQGWKLLDLWTAVMPVFLITLQIVF